MLHRQHSILRKKNYHDIFSMLAKKAFESFMRKLYMMFLNIFMVGKKLFSLQTLMAKQLGTVEGPT
jgi:hypothetical protein